MSDVNDDNLAAGSVNQAGNENDKSSKAVMEGNDSGLSMVLDIPVRVSLEVGKAELSISELLSLKKDAVIELDRKVGEPLDLRVNGRLVARGEVVEVDGTYGVRLSYVVNPSEAGIG